jgi:hypothetical protein
MFGKADSNANPFECLMDSDHKISVPRDPVDSSAKRDVERFRIDSGDTHQILQPGVHP